MARWRWTAMSCLLLSMTLGNAMANDEEGTLELDFLEFLGEGKHVDGEYHDPLQMQDWLQKEVVEAGQQQEDKDHE